MARPEERTKGCYVRGILPDGLVTVVDVHWHRRLSGRTDIQRFDQAFDETRLLNRRFPITKYSRSWVPAALVSSTRRKTPGYIGLWRSNCFPMKWRRIPRRSIVFDVRRRPLPL